MGLKHQNRHGHGSAFQEHFSMINIFYGDILLYATFNKADQSVAKISYATNNMQKTDETVVLKDHLHRTFWLILALIYYFFGALPHIYKYD